MDRHERIEFRAIREHYLTLEQVVTRGRIPAALFAKGLITDDTLNMKCCSTKEWGKAIMKEVLVAVRVDPASLQKFCKALELEADVVGHVLEDIQETLRQLNNESDDRKATEDYQNLKSQLEAFKKTLATSSSQDIQSAVISCIQDQVRQYIDKALKSGMEATMVKAEMDVLCCKEFVIPRPLWSWTSQEVEAKNEELTASFRNVSSTEICTMTKKNLKPSLFCKETLYHASLCCDAINSTSAANVQAFFRNKHPQHSITEVSFSQTRDCVTPYLIAKQGNTIYVAFQSIKLVSDWIGNPQCNSFEEGLRQQCDKIPIRFFNEQLCKNKKIVLTGFAFGGMLACCVGARLWASTTEAQILLERVVCITFGQPFLQIKMVQEEIEICPQFEESIHSIFYKEDFIPHMLGCLDESYITSLPSPALQASKAALVGPKAGDMPARLPMQPSDQLDGLFNIPFVKAFLQNLATLQECSLHEMKTYSKAISSPPPSRQRIPTAIRNLAEALMNVAMSRELLLTDIIYGNCYVMSKDKEKGIIWQKQPKKMASIELSHHTKLVANKLDKTLFNQHTMQCYKQLTFRSHLERPEKYVLPNQGQAEQEVTDASILKPKVITSEVSEYPNEYVIILEGENLWFSYKMCINEKGPNRCEIDTPAENTTNCKIEFHISDSHEASSALTTGGPVKITLYTHFAKPIRLQMNTKKEQYLFSTRQIQLAKHTPTQVIQLAYLCALLEQQGQASRTKRFDAIASFLEEAVKIVPLESLFDAIAYGRNDIALECAQALWERKPRLQSSQLMVWGLLRALQRAKNGYLIDDFIVPAIIRIDHLMQGAFQCVPGTMKQQSQHHQNPSQKSQMQHPLQVVYPSQTKVQPQGQPQWQTQQQSQQRAQTQAQSRPQQATHSQPQQRRQGHGQLPPKHHSQTKAPAAKKPMNEDGERSYSDVASVHPGRQGNEHQLPVLPQQASSLPMGIPVFLQRRPYPLPPPFPPHLVQYLNKCVNELFQQQATRDAVYFGKELNVVGRTNIEEVYSTRKQGSHFKSPLQVLRNAMEHLEIHTKGEAQPAKLPYSPKEKMHNEEMLKLLDEIYNSDVAICASLLGAFMEHQIRIPLLKSEKDTAETLSSMPNKVAVGVWALFSHSLADLQQMLSSSENNALIIEIKDYIKGISEQLPENEDRMYAGKLQFILQGMKKTVTSSSQYISYSLEHQLCSNLKFKKTTSLQKLISQWDKIFENDALSLVAKSHRTLVARWLKWAILIHDLREVLAQYTCIGVTGLVNSGKSQLVKKLFDIEKVKVGTRAAMRTTVPLLYNLEGKVDGLDVIDFPGVDDDDHTTVPELADLLLSLAQIVVFVVDYRKASTKAVKRWLQALQRNGVPVLVCLTHADMLYLECTDEDKRAAFKIELERIKEELKFAPHHVPQVYFCSFCQVPGIEIYPDHLREVGIMLPSDVGNWLVQMLKTKLKQADLAEKLQEFIEISM